MKLKIILFVVLFSLIYPLSGQNYVKVIKANANIRLSPSTTSNVVVQAKYGNIFEIAEEKGEWYAISMFSGEYRYIHKLVCEKTNYILKLPQDENLRKRAFKSILNAEDNAQIDADKKYPNDLYANIDYDRILIDRYKLEVMNKYHLQPPVYTKLIVEGVKKKWM